MGPILENCKDVSVATVITSRAWHLMHAWKFQKLDEIREISSHDQESFLTVHKCLMTYWDSR